MQSSDSARPRCRRGQCFSGGTSLPGVVWGLLRGGECGALGRDFMTYSYPVYVPGIAIAITVVAALIGLGYWQRKSAANAALAWTVAGLGGVVFAPMLLMTRVVVDEEKVEQTTGFWFYGKVKGFRLAEVASITTEEVGNRRGTREVWHLTKKNGQAEQIVVGDMWREHSGEILEFLRAKGIDAKSASERRARNYLETPSAL